MSKTIIAMVLLVLSFTAYIILYQMKKKQNNMIIFCLCVSVLSGILSGKLVGYILPFPSENLEVALTDINESAKEFFITEILVDGKKIEISSQEKEVWVRRGNEYGWINGKDTILENIPSNVEFSIPKGYTRKMVFTSIVDSGTVTVKLSDEEEVIDLQSGKNVKNITLPSSDKKELYIYKASLIFLFGIIYILIYAIILTIVRSKKVNFENVLSKYSYYFIYAFIAILSYSCMLCYAERNSMWYDEMFTLGYAMSKQPANSSFITFQLMRWYINNIPYGQLYVYLLSITAVAVSVYMIGLIGKRIRNGNTGIYASAILAFSSYIYYQVAFEFRTYFMLLLTSVTTCYLFMVRNENDKKKNRIWIIIYGLSLMMLMDSQEYGKLVAGFFICVDIVLILLKRIKKSNILSMIFPVFYGIYWIINNDVGGLWNNYTWPQNPTPKLVYNTLYNLFGNSDIVLYMFLIGTTYIIINIIKEIREHKTVISILDKWLNYITLITIVFAIFSASIIYSNFINPKNSLYVDRYFICVIAYMIIIASVGIDFFLSIILKNENKENRNIICIVCSCILILSGWQGYVNSKDEHDDPYRETAQYMNLRNDIYDKDTVVFIPEGGYIVAGWNYYFTEGGKRKGPNLCNKFTFEENVDKYDNIYVLNIAYGLDEKEQKYLDSHYTLKETFEDYSIELYKKNK